MGYIIHSLEGEKEEERENTNERESELLGGASLAIPVRAFSSKKELGGALQSFGAGGVGG